MFHSCQVFGCRSMPRLKERKRSLFFCFVYIDLKPRSNSTNMRCAALKKSSLKISQKTQLCLKIDLCRFMGRSCSFIALGHLEMALSWDSPVSCDQYMTQSNYSNCSNYSSHRESPEVAADFTYLNLYKAVYFSEVIFIKSDNKNWVKVRCPVFLLAVNCSSELPSNVKKKVCFS